MYPNIQNISSGISVSRLQISQVWKHLEVFKGNAGEELGSPIWLAEIVELEEVSVPIPISSDGSLRCPFFNSVRCLSSFLRKLRHSNCRSQFKMSKTLPVVDPRRYMASVSLAALGNRCQGDLSCRRHLRVNWTQLYVTPRLKVRPTPSAPAVSLPRTAAELILFHAGHCAGDWQDSQHPPRATPRTKRIAMARPHAAAIVAEPSGFKGRTRSKNEFSAVPALLLGTGYRVLFDAVQMFLIRANEVAPILLSCEPLHCSFRVVWQLKQLGATVKTRVSIQSGDANSLLF